MHSSIVLTCAVGKVQLAKPDAQAWLNQEPEAEVANHRFAWDFGLRHLGLHFGVMSVPAKVWVKFASE